MTIQGEMFVEMTIQGEMFVEMTACRVGSVRLSSRRSQAAHPTTLEDAKNKSQEPTASQTISHFFTFRHMNKPSRIKNQRYPAVAQNGRS